MDFSFIGHLLKASNSAAWITFGAIAGAGLLLGLFFGAYFGRNKVTSQFMGRRFAGITLAILGVATLVAIPASSLTAGPQKNVNEEIHKLTEIDDEGHLIKLVVRDDQVFFSYEALNDDGTVTPKYGIYDWENLTINEIDEGETPTLIKRDEFCEYVDVFLVTGLTKKCSATLELNIVDEEAQFQKLNDEELDQLIEAWNARDE